MLIFYATKPLVQRRREILVKSSLAKKDKQELKELEAKIGTLPAAESAADIQAMDIIRKAAGKSIICIWFRRIWGFGGSPHPSPLPTWERGQGTSLHAIALFLLTILMAVVE
jgi:hypothetical protein